MQNPRHVVAKDGKLFISNWGDTNDREDDYIAIFDLVTFQLIEKVSVDFGPEKMVAGNSNRLYVAHKGAINSNNKITVINTTTNFISNVLEVGDVPGSLHLDEASILWVLCEGKPASSGEESFGQLFKIDTRNNHDVSAMFEMAQQHPRNLTVDGVSLYYAIDNAIYKMNAQASSLPSSPLISGINVYSLTAASNRLYIGDAGNFLNPGELIIFDDSGTAIKEFVVGIRPVGVYFNN